MAFGKFSQISGRASQENEIGQKPVVLVIDDNRGTLEGLECNLRRNYRVRLCSSGEEGLQQLDSDVRTVILDIKMPGQNGFQVYEKIKKRFPDLPIIFYSAYQNMIEATKLDLKYKPFSYYEKGDNVQGLFEIIDRAVAHYNRVLNLLQTAQRLQEMKQKRE